MKDEWYVAKRGVSLRNGLIERVVPNHITSKVLDIYGTWTTEKGAQSRVVLMDWARRADQKKLRPKTWIRQTVVWEKLFKIGDWSARKLDIKLCVTMVKNEETGMWERLELE